MRVHASKESPDECTDRTVKQTGNVVATVIPNGH
jgi:hypothetical protein